MLLVKVFKVGGACGCVENAMYDGMEGDCCGVYVRIKIIFGYGEVDVWKKYSSQ